jgi:hypothetical protein
MSESVNLHKLLLQKQALLRTQLEAASAHWHPDAKGDVGEVNWAAALDGRRGDGFLPGRYAVSDAFIIDADGHRSDQIDLVIHDAHFCPLFFEQAGHCYIPAESVYAVFEIKQDLTRDNVLYAAKKAASVRGLRRTSVPIIHAGGTYPEREPFEVVAGILTTRSSWTEPFGDSLIKALGDVVDMGHLDFGAVIEEGAFDAHYANDLISITVSEPNAGLMFFLTRLYSRLQSLGTVTAIDLAQYARPLEAEPKASSPPRR